MEQGTVLLDRYVLIEPLPHLLEQEDRRLIDECWLAKEILTRTPASFDSRAQRTLES